MSLTQPLLAPNVTSSGLAGPDARLPPWRGSLSLAFERRGERTVLARRQHHGPLLLQKALYPEGDGVCHGVILHPPGALADGDTLIVQGQVGAGAHAVLSAPAATQWFKIGQGGQARGGAEQQVHWRVAPGARLEWLPRENIYFNASRCRQQFVLEVAEGASAIGWEMAVLGRRAHGETWCDAEVRSSQRLVDPSGRPLWEEHQVLQSGSGLLSAPQGLAGFPAYGTLWAVGAACQPALAEAVAAGLPFTAQIRAGVTTLPGGVLLARAVADQVARLRHCFQQLWMQLRHPVLGVPGLPLRLWQT